jgi:hypothetical protein
MPLFLVVIITVAVSTVAAKATSDAYDSLRGRGR